jgi:uncharacterized protein (TIGR02145 family)
MLQFTIMIKKYKAWIFNLVGIGIMLIISCTKEKPVEETENSMEDYTVSVRDIDGNPYHSVWIGDREWMVENLKVTRLNDGTPLPCVVNGFEWGSLESPGYCWYDNAESVYKEEYGAIYNWHAVQTGKLAPKGWHVATNEDWVALVNYLLEHEKNFDFTIDLYSADRSNHCATFIADTIGWYYSEFHGDVGNYDSFSAKNNKTGFSAKAGGLRRENGAYHAFGMYAGWWSSSDPEDTLELGVWDVSYSSECIGRSHCSKDNGLAVRCVRDKD